MAELKARGRAKNVQTATSKAGKVYKKFDLGVRFVDKAWGDRPETVTWLNLKVADFTDVEVEEGAYIEVNGRFNVKKYTGKDGQEKFNYDLLTSEVTIMQDSADGQVPKAAKKLFTEPEKDPWE